MRNLKRVLSLGLASVMLMGMMVTGAGAVNYNDFTDKDEIEYVEAVMVMNALGILEGGDNGAFVPDGILTREQAAKIICYMLLGPETAEKLSTNSSAFTDVAADRWSATYIAYCVNMGILAGDGAGNFFPEGELTGLAFAKMVLVALGKDAEEEGYVGSEWAINVAVDAAEMKLVPDGVVLAEPMTREQAAQMAFTALTTGEEETTTSTKYVVSVTDSGTTTTTIYDTYAAAKDAVDAASSEGKPATVSSITVTDTEIKGSLAETVFKLSKSESAEDLVDAFGRPQTVWMQDGEEIASVADEADLTYTSAVSGGKVYTDLGKPSGATVNFVEDGKDATYSDFSIASGDKDEVGGNGTLVEVYKTGDKAYKIVLTNTYIGTVTTHEDAVKDNNGDITTKEYITITGGTVNPGTLADSGKVETTAFTEDDVDNETRVLYTAAWDTTGSEYVVKSAVAAKSDVVTVSSVTTGKSFVGDGTTYKLAAKNDGAPTYSSAEDATNEYTIYFDSYGNVIFAETVDPEDLTTGYAMVTAVTAGGSDWSDGSSNYQAKMIMSDGEEKVVDIDKDSYDIFNSAVGSSTYGFNKAATLVKYTIEDGKYTFENTNAGSSVVPANADTTFALTSGVSKVTFKSTETADYKYANGKTLFFIGTTEDGKVTYEVVTGIANMTSIVDQTTPQTKVAYLTNEDATTVLDAVVIIDAKDAAGSDTTVDDIAYLVYDADAPETTDAMGTYKTYTAIVSNEITTVKVKSDKVSTIFSGNNDILVAKLTYNDKGLVTGVSEEYAEDVAEIAAQAITTAPKDGVIQLATAGYTSIADDCTVYVIDDGEVTTGNLSSLKTTVTSVACITVDGVITTAYVVK